MLVSKKKGFLSPNEGSLPAFYSHIRGDIVNFVEREDLHSHSLSSLLRRSDFQLNASIHSSSPLNKMAGIDDFVEFSVGFLRGETDDEVFCADFDVFFEAGNVFSDDAFCRSRGLIYWLPGSENFLKIQIMSSN